MNPYIHGSEGVFQVENKKGFTIIELVIVLGLVGMVLSMIFIPVTFATKNFSSENKRMNNISNARVTMDYLTTQIRKSNEIRIDDDKIKIGTNIYKLENRTLFKDEQEVINGIDELIINKSGETVVIKIIIKNNKGEDYVLSSIINIR